VELLMEYKANVVLIEPEYKLVKVTHTPSNTSRTYLAFDSGKIEETLNPYAIIFDEIKFVIRNTLKQTQRSGIHG
jgi:hypothetical protein